MFKESFIELSKEVTYALVDESTKAREAASDKEGRKAATITKPYIMREIAKRIGDESMLGMPDVLLSHIFTCLQEYGHLDNIRCVQGPYGGVQYKKDS